MSELVLVQGDDGVWRKKEEPYTVIEVQTKEDYERLERWLKVGSKMQWRDGSIPPTVEGETVLVLISGKHRGIEFRYACEQAAYYRDEGWILEHYPEFTNARISHWMPLPELPEAIERELHEG